MSKCKGHKSQKLLDRTQNQICIPNLFSEKTRFHATEILNKIRMINFIGAK